jgi:hypothetical protein
MARVMGGETAGPLLITLVIAARAGHGLFIYRRGHSALTRILASLRALPSEARSRALEGIQPSVLRDYLAEILAHDGTDDRDAEVERFPFPTSMHRRAAQLYWIAWALTAACLGAVLVLPPSSGQLRLLLIGIGVVGATAAWFCSRRQRTLQSVIEINRFRISEVMMDGRRRSLFLNRYLELTPEPKKRRALLKPPGTDDGILLHYDRLGFNRLADLVLEYGGFESNAPAS